MEHFRRLSTKKSVFQKYLIFPLFIFLVFPNFLIAQQPIKFSLRAPESTKSISVVGDFNNWDKNANPLHDKNGDGIWKTEISLKPGIYQYRFLLDGVRWIKDPANPRWSGPYSNSTLFVTKKGAPQLTNLKPETGSVLRRADITIRADYRSDWRKIPPDLQKSEILLNGRKLNFIFNEKESRLEILPGKLKDGEYDLQIRIRDKEGNSAPPLQSYFIVNAVNSPPVADAGFTTIAAANSKVTLNSGVCYDPDREPIENYRWKMISKPAHSKTKLKNSHAPFPSFVPDKVGRYVFTVQISDGRAQSKIDTVDVYSFVRHEYPVKFELADSVFFRQFEKSIDSVSVAGEFNNWSANATPLHDYNHDGVWTAWVNLDPGEYEYKFVVNGKHWIPDPTNDRKVPDGWNGYNSVIASTKNLAPVIAVQQKFAPGKIILDASKSQPQMGESLEFLWFQDINNPQRFKLPHSPNLQIPQPKQNGTYYFYLVTRDKYGNTSQEIIALFVERGMAKIANFSQTPDWARDAIVYEIFPRKFHPSGNLRGIIEKLPYLKSLGINCIWLMPVWEGPTEHGYGPTNFFAIESDYGTIADFRDLLQKAHAAGIRLILDFVANHTSDQHPYFLSAYQNRFSAFRDWYRWKSTPAQDSFYSYEFHNDWDTLPNLNYENPNVRRYVLDAAKFWANLGVDGFRCDVAWGVPHDFWKRFRRELKQINPDILLIDEVLPRSPAYHKDEFDMSYDTDFYGNVLDVLNGKKPLTAIHYGLEKTKKNYPRQTLDFRYLENHDLERFVKTFGLEKTKLAATLLLTVPGTPLIYYGQEIGLTGKTPTMAWDKVGNDLYKFYQKLILLRREHRCFRRGEMVKIPTDHEQEVYAYLRFNKNEKFLVVLNFGDQPDQCRFVVPEKISFFKSGKKFILQDILGNEIPPVKFIDSNHFQMELQPGTGKIFRLYNNFKK
ncbi:MAG: hypothetical protein GXO74_00130 [Calditrichaeota bacterium]|nr:hypothetical protein [Calditrichota bacterium]